MEVLPYELSREEKEFREKLAKELQLVINTGKLKFGFRNTVRALQRGKAKAVVTALNTPKEKDLYLKYLCALANVPYIKFPGTVKELGEICRRPHVISALAILDPGTSEIIKLGEIPAL
ncbi:MAG: 50S ribosomal protein L30e [Candidatus Njordarchaeales archaeon]